jgi:hypothetical protein
MVSTIHSRRDSEPLHAAEAEAARAGEFSLADGIRYLWSGRYWFAIPALVGLLIAVAVFFFTGISRPSTTTYRFAISLTMPLTNANGDRQTGNAVLADDPATAWAKYLNGVQYSPNDLRSAAVLDEVYRLNNLQDFGLDMRRFSGSVSVEPYSPAQASVADRYRSQLARRNITSEERKALEDQFRLAINQAKYDGAIITFIVPDSVQIPASVANKVVSDIPLVWSRIYGEMLGVGENIGRSEMMLADSDLARALDYPLAYDYLRGAHRTLVERIDQAMTVPGAATAVLQDPPMTLSDLSRLAHQLGAISISGTLRAIADTGLSRNAYLTTLEYESKVERLKAEERLASQKAAAIRAVSLDDLQPQGGEAMEAIAGVPTRLSPSAGAIISDDVIDKVIGLARIREGAEFKQELAERHLAFLEEAAVLADQRQAAAARLQALRSSAISAEQAAAMEKEFAQQRDFVVGQLNGLWSQLSELQKLVSVERLGGEKRLFAALPIDDRVVRTTFYSSPYLWMLAFGLPIALGIAGITIYILRSIVQTVRRQ